MPNVSVFGDRPLMEVIKGKSGHRSGLSAHRTGVLLRRGADARALPVSVPGKKSPVRTQRRGPSASRGERSRKPSPKARGPWTASL